MRRLVAYYCFIIISIMVALGFLGAQDLPQLIGAIIFYPLAVYFTLLVSPKSHSHSQSLSCPGRHSLARRTGFPEF